MRATRLVVLTAMLVTALVSVGPPAAGVSPPGRAMFVWGRPPVAELVAFAAENGVQDLFVSVPDAVATSLAVETNFLGDDAVTRKQTFYGFTRTELARALGGVDAVASSYSFYRGMVVHDYRGWT